MSERHPLPARHRIRWWPVIVILALVAARLFQVWVLKDYQRQFKVLETAKAVFVGLGLLLLWLFAFSRLRWAARFTVFGALVGLIVLCLVVFRFRGVTGDVVPVFEPRWKLRPREAYAPAQAPAVLPAARSAPATDFPQFLGPARDGTISGIRLARDWQARPPQLLWRRPVGEGWGGFSIVGDRALTQEQDGPNELITCSEVTTGRRLWAHSCTARYDNPIGGIGPRATPTVMSNRVYALGATGVLTCLELATGRVLWSTNVVGSVAPGELEWGVSSSPLVYSNLVVVAPLGGSGHSLAAYRAETGELVWTGGSARPHYSSPRLEALESVPQILTFAESAAGHDPASGAVLWEYPWGHGFPHITDPRVIGTNLVLISSGYGGGSHLVEVRRDLEGRWAATNTVWRSMRLKSKFANILLRDGFAYGLDDGRLLCLDLKDGSQRWEGDRYGHGQLLLVEDVILLTAENGDVALVEARPDAFHELSRFGALKGKTWNPPALAGDILLVRHDREAAAYRLPLEP